jgi:hypothetical protein
VSGKNGTEERTLLHQTHPWRHLRIPGVPDFEEQDAQEMDDQPAAPGIRTRTVRETARPYVSGNGRFASRDPNITTPGI